ncbi:MAG TPA: response regulator [Methylomirabilota bacterium]|nr:response regulator [Methylomirabilota bacterium]
MDDEHARALLAAVLRADGYPVDAAATRTEALALIDRHAYVLVLSALRMPGLDGSALSEALEARWPLAMPALIFVTGPAFTPDFARFLMESAAPLLPWPARPADISRMVARSLAPTPA